MRSALASAFLTQSGWEPEGERPRPRRFVLIAAPHTSNWDLAYLLALAESFELRVSWLGKSALELLTRRHSSRPSPPPS